MISITLGLAISLLVNSCPNLRWHRMISSLSFPLQLAPISPDFSEQSLTRDLTKTFCPFVKLELSPKLTEFF